ncbi:MAG: hypothetical protein JXR89_11065, partial [Deltaproteobacteria bacterium]|nr:hypothetical protein [Deltaproteobacteria bacterium]
MILRFVLVFFLLGFFMLSGLGKNFVLAEEKFDFNKLSESQERQIMYPSLTSADDYRQGQVEQRTINLNEILRGEVEGEPSSRQRQDYEKRLRRLEQQGRSSGRTLSANGALRRGKVGILFASGLNSPAAEALLRWAPELMAAQGFIYLDPSQLQPVLNNFRYRQALRNPVAIASFLSEYPGCRYLLFIQNLSLPGGFPGVVELAGFVVDGYAGQTYSLRPARESVNVPGQVEAALGRTLQQFLGALQNLVAGGSFQGKIFLVQGPRLYLNIGLLSGLVAGQELEVLSQSRTIYDPRTGLATGMVPGFPCGRI